MPPITQEDRQIAVETPLGPDVLVLTSFSGGEEISQPFQFHLEMVSDEDSIAAKDIVGKKITVRVRLADGTSFRYFNGMVSRFSAGGRQTGLRRYQAEMVPWLWFLSRGADCRVFQNKSVPDIIEEIFSDLGFSDYEISEVKGEHPPRDYSVQFRESPLAFISRLMEEEGIFYFFKHEDGKHTLVMGDQKGAYQDCPENEVEYQYSYGGQTPANRLTGWEHQYEFTPGKWSQTDYNFEDHPARSEPTPANLLLTSAPTTIDLDNINKFEIYEYPGAYGDKSTGERYAKLRMEAEEAAHDVVSTGGTCKTFGPGGKFTITKHDCAEEEGKAYAITSIQHSASQSVEAEAIRGGGASYENSLTCIPADVIFRPRRTTPKPVVQGVQTAVVTGPPGEEIWPDKFGRVKVQFFWDRHGKRDENSSCWVRVSQDYAGKNWGSMNIPRIGQEVLVEFVDGDLDRPIITGRVYNADQMPPYSLPDKKVVSGMISYSSPGGGGYNEISMNDTKDDELITIHAQFDIDTTIENDLREHVLNDRTRDVANDETISVGSNQTLDVGADQAITVGAAQTITVGGSRTQDVGKSESLTVGSSQTLDVGTSQDVTVGTAMSVSAGTGITLEVGPSKIEITPQGITISGPMVQIQGSALTEVKGGLVKIN